LLLNRLIYTLPSRLSGIIYSVIKYHYRKARIVNFRGINLKLLPSVFHPKLYLTTETFLDFLLTIDLNGKTTLELGCGSAAISFYLGIHRNANVHVSDINSKAIDGANLNAKNNQLVINSYHSDLFENIPQINFDILLLNPPFFNQSISSVDQYAFNTGKDFDYFKRLALALIDRKTTIENIFMILTNKSNQSEILSHFKKTHFQCELVLKIKALNETHFIYSISFA